MGTRMQNEQGTIYLSNEVFTTISGWLATNCFGVRGMAASTVSDGLVQLLQRDNIAKGIKVFYNEDNTVGIELHIIVEHGVNIPAVSQSIMSEVSYMVHRLTGIAVAKVDVYVDGMMTEK